MEFLPGKIGDKLLKALEASTEVVVAVAYFRPNRKTQNILKSIPALRLIVGGDFTINNPYDLEELTDKGHDVKVLYPDILGLHAKVIAGKGKDGDWWAVVGSANLTHKGLFENEEACIWLDEKHYTDIENILKWFRKISKQAIEADWDIEKKVYDTKRLRVKPLLKTNEQKCWVIKCHDNSGTNYWEQFFAEDVIAIGWERLAKDPIGLSHEQLAQEIRKVYPNNSNRSCNRDATIIKKFCEEIREGDKVVICNGYAGNMKKDLYVYGIATVDNKFKFNRNSNWWKCKISASIQSVENTFPVQKVRDTLRKNTMRSTLHRIEATNFNNFCKMLNNEKGD